MSLADVSHGPDWVIWIVFAIFVALAITFLTGHGSSLIAGYNTASEKEKAKYDEKEIVQDIWRGDGSDRGYNPDHGAIGRSAAHGSGLCDRRDYFCGRDRNDHSWQYGVQAAVVRGFFRIVKRKLTGDQI